MDGVNTVATITSILPESELNKLFAEGVSRLQGMEKEIEAARVAVAIGPDGSRNLLKGSNVLKERIAAKQDSLEAMPINVTLPVFAETLWRAFGDGATVR